VSRQSKRFIVSICVKAVRTAKHTGECLNGYANDVVEWLLYCERNACRLRVKAQLKRALVLSIKTLLHHSRPDAARRAILRYLLEEIVVRVEEEGDARHKLINVKPCLNAPLNIFDAVAQGEREFLQSCRTSFAYVIAAHRNRIVTRHVAIAELECVRDEFHRRTNRINPLLLRYVLLKYVVLKRAGNLLPIRALLFSNDQIHCQKNGSRSIDCLRDCDLFERNAIEQNFHVRERRDSDAALADFAFR